jgi:hypothetical protein
MVFNEGEYMPKLKHYDLSQLKEEQLAYLAGFIDGEGCFFIGRFNTVSLPTRMRYMNYHTILKISNNNLDVLNWISKTFYARTTVHNKKTKDKTRNFITYDCYFTGNLLLPFLIIKKPQAEIMLKMRATFPRSGSIGQTKVSQEVLDLRAELHREMHRLNSRFKNHPLKEDLYNNLAPCLPSA